MEKLNSIEKSWVASFESSNAKRMMQAIMEVRNSGSINILPVLFEQLHRNDFPVISNEIIKMISEIKSQNAVPVIAKSLQNKDYGDNQKDIIAACWQSGLDFSKFLDVFTGLFISGNYETALEAFTVIEESLPNAGDEEIHQCIHILKDSENIIAEEKMPLFRELRKVVESY
ncbi:MAG TPA: hypothetical protein VK179_14920 [Bacteroidales bacterium]|nr:hypothetical protein [Bacteroidales bacterium]